MLRSDKDEPHQEHRLGTLSNNITWGGGLNRFYEIPTLALDLDAVHIPRFQTMSNHLIQ